jgi:hypothetical protein
VPWACFPAWWARNAAYIDDASEPPPTLSYDPVIIKRSSLLQQLHDTRRSRSTDPRDKVFALLGLLSPEDKWSILPDYTTSVESVYVGVAVAIINRQASLRILSGVGDEADTCYGRASSSDLPSWVPDWSTSPLVASLGLSNIYLEPYDAGGSPACGVILDKMAGARSSLGCLGITLDVVGVTALVHEQGLQSVRLCRLNARLVG